MFTQIKNFKFQIQHQAVTVSDFSLSKVTSHKIFVSYDVAPDIDTSQVITRVFSKTIHGRNQTMYSYMVARLKYSSFKFNLRQ